MAHYAEAIQDIQKCQIASKDVANHEEVPRSFPPKQSERGTMTEEERTAMQQRARDRASEYSYDDTRGGKTFGRTLEVRKAPNPQ